MSEFASVTFLAPLLTAIGTIALVCALFHPLLRRTRLSGQRSAIFEAFLKGRHEAVIPQTRNVRRAQEAALKLGARRKRGRPASLLRERLTAAGLDWRPASFIALCFIFGATLIGAGLAANLSLPSVIAIGGLCAWLLPQRWLGMRIAKRQKLFLTAFTTAVDMVLRGAKSGLAVTDCLAMVASDAPAPVRGEFETILAQLRAGIPLPAAMDRLAMAMPLPEVRFFATIMSAQSQAGGNLSEALGNLSGILRDREKLAARIRIASAEGRASALIIGALPFIVIGAAAAFAPDYIAFLWLDETGRKMGAFCAVWLIIGIWVLNRMARIEV